MAGHLFVHMNCDSINTNEDSPGKTLFTNFDIMAFCMHIVDGLAYLANIAML